LMRWTSPRKCLRRMRLDASSELRYAASIAPALDVMTTGGGSVGGRDARVRTNDDETKSISPAASSVFRSDGAVSAAVARVAMPASPRAAAAAAASDDAAAGVALPCHPGVFLAVVVALVSVAVSWLDLARETTLGIDLGTTHSVAATCDKGVVSVVRVDGGVRADGGWDDGDDDDGFGGFGGGLTLPSVVRFERRRRRRRRKDDDDDDDDDSYDVVAIGADNMAVEVLPAEKHEILMPVHQHCLAEAGVYLVENLALDALAKAGIHSFCLAMIPIKFKGATGSPVRPVAMV